MRPCSTSLSSQHPHLHTQLPDNSQAPPFCDEWYSSQNIQAINFDLTSYRESMICDSGRFFWRCFLATKALTLLSVKSPTQGWRHLSCSNKGLFQPLKARQTVPLPLGNNLMRGQKLKQKTSGEASGMERKFGSIINDWKSSLTVRNSRRA